MGEIKRCEICGWPLKERVEDGCVEGNCSYRPHQGTEEYNRIQQRREEVAKRKLDELAHSLAHESAVSIIDCESLRAGRDDGDWREIEPEGEVELVDALRYLELRGLLQRHPENPNWVTVLDESEATAP